MTDTRGESPPERSQGVPAAGSDAPAGRTHRLAFYIPNLTMGGAEQVTVSIVNGLADRGHEVDLLVSHQRGELRSEIDAAVDVMPLGSVRVPVAGVGAHVAGVARYLRQTEPAVLFPQLLHAGVVSLAASGLVETDTRVVPTAHCALAQKPTPTMKARLTRRLAAELYPSADRVVAVSEGVADDLVAVLSLDRGQVSVINNPVQVDRLRERAAAPVDHPWLDEECDVVLFVGRQEPQKDLETWLRTFQRVHERLPDVRGILAGAGSQRSALQKRARELGLESVVSFPGYVDNPYGLMAAADTFLLSSRFEGLPTVLIEALACGCPVVSTDCPSGPREILADGSYGRLAPVGDWEALADAVVATLDDPPPEQELKRRADHYGPDNVLAQYEQFVASLLAH